MLMRLRHPQYGSVLWHFRRIYSLRVHLALGESRTNSQGQHYANVILNLAGHQILPASCLYMGEIDCDHRLDRCSYRSRHGRI